MKEYEAECCSCGAVMNKYWMEPIPTGRKIKYLCPKCYKEADRGIRHWQSRMRKKEL